MKTAFKVKMIFETPNRTDLGEGNELTMKYMIDTINSGKVTIEAINDAWTQYYEPVLIIKEKEL